MPTSPTSGSRFDLGGANYTEPTTASVADTFVENRVADTSKSKLVSGLVGEGINLFVGNEQRKLDEKLRTIATAREQGSLSASAASVRARTVVKEATARLPGLGEDFRRQAASFFSEFGEGSGVLDLTQQEQMQQKLQMQRLSAAQAEQIEADELGMTVEALRYRKRLGTEVERINNELALDTKKSFYQWAPDYNAFTSEKQTSRIERLSAASVEGKGIDEDARAYERQLLNVEVSQLRQMVRNLAVADPTAQQQLMQQVDAYYNNQNQLIDQANINDYLTTKKTRTDAELDIYANQEFGHWLAIKDVIGPDNMRWALEASSDPRRASALRNLSPGIASVIDNVGHKSFERQLAEAVYGIRDSVSGVTQEELNAGAALTANSEGAPKGHRRANLEYLAGQPGDPNNLRAFRTNSTQRLVRTDQETANVLQRAVQVKESSLKVMIQDQGLIDNLGNYEISRGQQGQIKLKQVRPFTPVTSPGGQFGTETAGQIPNSLKTHLEELLQTLNTYPEMFLETHGTIESYLNNQFQVPLPEKQERKEQKVRKVIRDESGNLRFSDMPAL